jgi:hypothetical protein
MTDPTFRPFPKLARWNREVIITEKIDGTNASVWVLDDGRVLAGSRNRFITPENDNFGFAKWVREHEDELRLLGPGTHFGEWWGKGIQRGYGLDERRFSLFNVSRWGDDAPPEKGRRPECCHVVPVLVRTAGDYLDVDLLAAFRNLRTHGSVAAPGFMRPEGVVLHHVAAGASFKKLLENDDVPKGAAKREAA